MKATINVIIKEPNKEMYRTEIPNTLEALQNAVNGYIETFPMNDSIIICNEEGRLLDLDYNFTVCGNDFFGTCVICGIDPDDPCEFGDVPF